MKTTQMERMRIFFVEKKIVIAIINIFSPQYHAAIRKN